MSYKNENATFPVHLHSKNNNGEELKLYYQRWIPNEGAKPDHNLVIHHGLGEHSDRYGNVLGMLEGTGVTVYSYDVRGHARSEGKKGLAEDVYQLAGDLDVFLDFIKKEHSVSKPILYGHSMGGATVLAYLGQSTAHQEKVKAVIATGSALGVEKNCYQKVMSTLLTCLKGVIPSACLDAGLDTDKLSTDKNVVEAFKGDKLTHDLISVSLAFSLLEDGQKKLIPSAKDMKLPIFLAHGELDVITAPSGTQGYYDNCASLDKTLKIYPGLYHEVHNEVKEEKEKVLADLKKFVTDHL